MHKRPFFSKILFAFLAVLLLLSVPCGAENGYFRDDLGRDIYLPSEPKRIVSLAPNITEILFALGLGDRVVGVTDYCNYPPAARKKEKVGMLLNPSVEKIISLSPDLVLWLSEGDNEKTFANLEKSGVKIFVISPVDIKSLIKSLSGIGKICRREKEAEVLINDIQTRLRKVEERISGLGKEKTLFLIDVNPPISVSGGSFNDEMIRLAGGENIVKTDMVRYPRIGWEDVARLAPEVIIIAKHSIEIEKKLSEFKNRPAIAVTPAFRNGRIHMVDGDILTRMSPRIIDGIEIMARLIHPEAFR